jgi:hypothetical protein
MPYPIPSDPSTTSPGAWTPHTYGDATSKPALFLADKIDSLTGELESVLVGMDPVDAWIVTQLGIEQGSGSAVQEEGHLFATFTKAGDDAATIADGELRRVLAPLVREGEIEIVSVTAEPLDDVPGDGVEILATYRQLRTQDRRLRHATTRTG